MSSIRTLPFGGNGGDPFPHTIVNEIGLRSGKYVDQIRVGSQAWGQNGGNDLGSITLDRDEYVSKVELRACDALDFLKLTTNKGRTIGGGGDGGDPHVLDNIRLIAIGGRCGNIIDQVSLKYVEDYRPSRLVRENVNFILSYTAPFQEFEERLTTRARSTESYELVTQHMVRQSYTASVQAEYYVTMAASTTIQVEDISTETMRRSTENEMEKFEKHVRTIPGGYVGVKLVTGSLMQGADGSYWMFPTGDMTQSVIPETGWQNLLNHYDLTGELHTQMPGLGGHMTMVGNYRYYG